ncbi:MAG: Uncharacterised protein [Cryomorphaceae bacterium]|nr:MAG: Uncharacterised protein [Cryomorphaceae bacterium]
MRKLFYILGAIILLSFLLFQGCRGLVKTIYASMDCDQFNIDHIELRTGIDIPKITRLHCEIADDTRTVAFQIHKTGEAQTQYAEKYFSWDGKMYSATGSNTFTLWSATYDTVSNVLNIELQYLDDE